MNYYEENIEFLSKRLIPIYDTIQNYIDSGLQTVEWINQHRTMRISQGNQKIYLQSIHDQQREIKKMLATKPEQSQTIVLFSIVSVALIKEIKKTYKNLNRVVIVEPSVKIFKEFMQHYSLKATLSLITDVKFSIVVQEDMEEAERDLQAFLGEGISTNIALITSIAYKQLYPEYLLHIIKLLNEAYSLKNINTNTLKHFKYKWLLNVWRNMGVPMYSLYDFMDLFSSYPCVMVSAGPSLQKNIHLIEELKKKAIVIAVGSAANILHNKGIRPHFIMAMDGSVFNNLIYGNLLEHDVDIPMLATRSLYYNVLQNYVGPKVEFSFFGSDEGVLIKEFFYQKSHKLYGVQAGLSIANVLHHMLLELGVKKLIFMGQDLCYTGGKIHSEGAWSAKARSLEDFGGRSKTIDINGEEVWTDAAFLRMLETFESSIEDYGDKSFHINATEGGLQIEGAENMTLTDVLELYLWAEEESDIEAVIKEIFASKQHTVLNEDYLKTVKQIAVSIDKILNIVDNQREMLQVATTNEKENLKYKQIKSIKSLQKKVERIAYFKKCIYASFIFELRKCQLADQGVFTMELFNCWKTYFEGVRQYLMINKELIKEALTGKMGDYISVN